MLQALLSKMGQLKSFTGSKSKAVAEWVAQTPSHSSPRPPHRCPWRCPRTSSCADGGALLLCAAFAKGMAGLSFAAHAPSPQLWSVVVLVGACRLPEPSDLLLVVLWEKHSPGMGLSSLLCAAGHPPAPSVVMRTGLTDVELDGGVTNTA